MPCLRHHSDSQEGLGCPVAELAVYLATYFSCCAKCCCIQYVADPKAEVSTSTTNKKDTTVLSSRLADSTDQNGSKMGQTGALPKTRVANHPSGSKEALKWGPSYVKFISSVSQNLCTKCQISCRRTRKSGVCVADKDITSVVAWIMLVESYGFSPHIHTENTQLIPVDFEGSLHLSYVTENFTACE